jgi:hypothetical protein
MTWRFIPPPWAQRLQYVTLVVTGLLGLSIACAPNAADPKLTAIEQAMSADFWALGLLLGSLVAIGAEWHMARHKSDRLVPLVAYTHILLCGLMVGYTSAAMWGVLDRVWWNFGAPAMGALLAYLHLLYTRRRRDNRTAVAVPDA